MNYHNITKNDMLNGDGLRVVLWVAGCGHHCRGCHNPSTWNHEEGIKFDQSAKDEIFAELAKEHVSGITLSGGDPLYSHNIIETFLLCCEIKQKFPEKTIWLYTGYTWEEIRYSAVINLIDVLVDGKFIEELADKNYKWAGSTNQRIINVPASLKEGKVIQYDESC